MCRVTPGTLIEDKFLNPRKSNYLCSIVKTGPNAYGLSWIDLSTAEFQTSVATSETIVGYLSRLAPSEVLINQDIIDDKPIKDALRFYHITTQTDDTLDNAKSALKNIVSDSLIDNFTPVSKYTFICINYLCRLKSLQHIKLLSM